MYHLCFIFIVIAFTIIFGETSNYNAPDTAWTYTIKYGIKTNSRYNAFSEISHILRINQTTYVGAGSTQISPFSATGAMFVAVDTNGVHQWDTVYTADSSNASAIVKMTDNSFLAFGSTKKLLHLWNISDKGVLVWDTIYQQCTTGVVNSVNKVNQDFIVATNLCIVKLSPNFSLKYVKSKYPVSSTKFVEDGYFALSPNYVIAKYDTPLDAQKMKVCKQVTDLDSIYFAGFINNEKLFFIGAFDIFLRTRGSTGFLQSDTSGRNHLFKEYSTFSWEIGWYGFAENDSELVLTGETFRDCYVRKVKLNDGSIIWEKSFNVNGFERIRFISKSTDGGYIACGDVSDDPLNRHGGLIMKFNAPQQSTVRTNQQKKILTDNATKKHFYTGGCIVNRKNSDSQKWLMLNGQSITNEANVKRILRGKL